MSGPPLLASKANLAGDSGLRETKGHVACAVLPSARFFLSDGVMKDSGCWAPAVITFIPLVREGCFPVSLRK